MVCDRIIINDILGGMQDNITVTYVKVLSQPEENEAQNLKVAGKVTARIQSVEVYNMKNSANHYTNIW
jgi:hypothetical protein